MDRSTVLKCFGDAIRNRRVILGLSQEELAEKAGLHRTYIGMVERAEKNLTIFNAVKLARALGIPVSDLFKELG
jgi:transcriptional regulator with XRE-family HTH domain